MVAQYAKKGRRQKTSKGGRGNARVKDRKRESEFSSARQFPNYREAFSSSSCHWCSTFRVLAPSEPLDTRVKCTNPLGLPPLSVCHEYVQLLLLYVLKKKNHRSKEFGSNESLVEPIIGQVGNDQHGVVHLNGAIHLIRNMRIFKK